MELILSLVSLAALAGFALLLARRTALPAPSAPFVALCGTMLWFAAAGMLGVLVPAGWVYFGLAAAAWGLSFAPVGRKNPLAALNVPGFTAFWVLAVALLAFFAWRQPMFSTWDEFSFWGTAAKIVKTSGGLYVNADIGWAWVGTHRPALVVLGWFFQFFGGYAEWRVLAGYDILLIAIFAALTAGCKKGAPRQWVPALGFGFLLFSAAVLICVLTGSLKLEGISEGFTPGVFLLFVLGFLICKCVVLIFRNVERQKTEGFFRGAQIFGAACMSFMHGAQDGQKFMGVILLCLHHVNASSPHAEIAVQMPIWLMLLCSLVMGLGTSICGKKINKTVGMDMVKLEKYQGFSADIAASLSLLFSSVFGIPVSTTHAKTTAIMGVGAVKRLSAINFGVVKDMGLTWILTFPGCGFIGFLMTKLFMWLF